MTQDNARRLGEWLRQRREELGISLQQAEIETRIRQRYLEALESEEIDALPDPVVGRGFLRNYAAYLGLDVAEATLRYSQVGAPPPPPTPPVDDAVFHADPFRPVALHDMPGFRVRRGWLAGLALVTVAAIALVVWQFEPYLYRLLVRPRATAPPTATLTVSAGLPTATWTPLPTVAAVTSTKTVPASSDTPEPTLTLTWTPSPSPSPTSSVYTGIFLELVFTDTSWIQVTVDGLRDFQGEVSGGSHRSWYAAERVELRIGNAGVVLVTVNGQALGTLGGKEEVIDRVFEKVGEGMIEGTMTPEPTSQVTRTVEPPEAPTAPPTRLPTATSTATLTTTTPISPTVSP